MLNLRIKLMCISFLSSVLLLVHHTVDGRSLLEQPILSISDLGHESGDGQQHLTGYLISNTAITIPPAKRGDEGNAFFMESSSEILPADEISSNEPDKVFLVEDNKIFEDTDQSYWSMQAQSELKNKLQHRLNKNKARNIILLMGDGMSIPTLSATRAYQGRMMGMDGEATKLSFEKFPHTGLSKTYCLNRQIADSACSATAYLCGAKANVGTVGLGGSAHRGDCQAQSLKANHVSSIAQWAQDGGKETGFITTTRVTHASPAGVYAHTAERAWEADVNVLAAEHNPQVCPDIATQLINNEPGKGLKVILGGGRKNFLPEYETDEEGRFGVRKDGKNLIKEWLDQKYEENREAKYIYNRKQLMDIDPAEVDDLLGLFDSNHMQFHLDADPETEPTLQEMTIKAIEMLQNSTNGYFLFVEGGLIDKAHHQTWARKALDETVEFSKAVAAAVRMTDSAETLIVVTSDHSHTMTYAGYADRGEDVLGLAPLNGTDGLPYTILSYANGPGYKPNDDNNERHNVKFDDISNVNYTFPSLIPLDKETHGGDDVAVFAQGPWAHLFGGNYEQNLIPHIIAYAACLGTGATLCDS